MTTDLRGFMPPKTLPWDCWQCKNMGKSLWSMTLGKIEDLCDFHQKEEMDFTKMFAERTTDFIAALRELREKATPGKLVALAGILQTEQLSDQHRPFIVIKDHDARQEDLRLLAELKNSLDLWLELAYTVKKFQNVLPGADAFEYAKWMGRMHDALKKLRGES